MMQVRNSEKRPKNDPENYIETILRLISAMKLILKENPLEKVVILEWTKLKRNIKLKGKSIKET